MCGICSNGHGKTELCYRPVCDQGKRIRRDVITNEQSSFQDVVNNINHEVDISFPIQGNQFRTTYGGIFPYVSVVETPGSAFFTVKVAPSTSEILIQLAIFCIPLFLLITMLSLTTGIIIWVLVRNHSMFTYYFILHFCIHLRFYVTIL